MKRVLIINAIFEPINNGNAPSSKLLFQNKFVNKLQSMNLFCNYYEKTCQ